VSSRYAESFVRILESPAFKGSFAGSGQLSVILGHFLTHAEYDRRLSRETIVKYRDSISRFIGIVGDGNVVDLTLEHFLEVKRQLFDAGIGVARL